MADIDTSNDCFVGAQGGGVVILLPPREPMDRMKTLRLAAYLLALAPDAKPGDPSFDEVLIAIEST